MNDNERLKQACVDICERDYKEETAKDKKEWLRLSGQLNFIRGNGHKYKGKRKKK